MSEEAVQVRLKQLEARAKRSEEESDKLKTRVGTLEASHASAMTTISHQTTLHEKIEAHMGRMEVAVDRMSTDFSVIRGRFSVWATILTLVLGAVVTFVVTQALTISAPVPS